MQIEQLIDFFENPPEDETPSFVELTDPNEELILNTMLFLNMMSYRSIMELLYISPKPQDETIKIADFCNLYYNQLMPRMIRKYKEKYDKRIRDSRNEACSHPNECGTISPNES